MTSQNETGLLSIMIPNYNYGTYIAKAIESVVRQDYESIELVIVDDGSTDNSLEVVQGCLPTTKDLARVEVLPAQKNQGKLAAINRAMHHIHGEYCIILDADDYLSSGYARRCIGELSRAHSEDPSIGFVYTDCNLISEDGNWLDRGRSVAFDPRLLAQYSFIPEPAVVLTRAMVEAGVFDETIRKGTKHHKWQRIVDNGWNGLHIAEPLFYYRMHRGNLSGIGKRVIGEIERGQRGERILSGYWPVGQRG
ncbi:MAG TPA: glycosyltransferase family A protein [Alphaproteobacteria bacterium]|nr:glycosyltransferase family A protein [Alphaproteobacteria bacterium]